MSDYHILSPDLQVILSPNGRMVFLYVDDNNLTPALSLSGEEGDRLREVLRGQGEATKNP